MFTVEGDSKLNKSQNPLGSESNLLNLHINHVLLEPRVFTHQACSLTPLDIWDGVAGGRLCSIICTDSSKGELQVHTETSEWGSQPAPFKRHYFRQETHCTHQALDASN